MATRRIEFASLRRPWTPNTFLLAPANACASAAPDALAPVYDTSAAKLRQAFVKLAIAAPRVSHVLSDARALYDEFVVRSALFGFPDLVSVQFLDLNKRTSTLALYARAVYGFSDMGVNRARSLAWLDKVNGVIKPQSA